jgi:membrane associated rhomboid family serine protease
MTFGLNIIIVAATVVVSLIAFNNTALLERLKFNAFLIKHHKQSWRFLSYALVHAGFLHLFVNMWVLYSFGGIVEHNFIGLFGGRGYLYYILLYAGGVIFSTVFDFGKHKDDPYYSAVGASGAVSAIVFSSILFYPGGGIYIFPIPFALPSWLFGILYLVYSVYMGRKGADNIGHNAHFWGAIFGIIFTIIAVPGIINSFFEQLF